jgi:RNA polymerase sigma-70 factor (ECF subfamily)
MSDDPSTIDLLARWREGDQGAEEELFSRYTTQLIALARSRLSPKLAGRIDAEDVVQSAYRSFFLAADRFVIQRSGDLWRLLAKITLRKLYRQAGRHTAARRNVARECPVGAMIGSSGVPLEILAREPSPAEAVAVVDELEQVMRGLVPLHRRMVELRLQGYQLKEIAADTSRSERLVRYVLTQVKDRLNELAETADPSESGPRTNP